MAEFAKRHETDPTKETPPDRLGKFEFHPVEILEPSIPVDVPEPRRTSLRLEREYLQVFGERVPALYLAYDTEEEYHKILQSHLDKGVPIDTRPGPNNISASAQV